MSSIKEQLTIPQMLHIVSQAHDYIDNIPWDARRLAGNGAKESLVVVPGTSLFRAVWTDYDQPNPIIVAYYPNIEDVLDTKLATRYSGDWNTLREGVNYLLSTSYSFDAQVPGNIDASKAVYIAGIKLADVLPAGVSIILPPEIEFGTVTEQGNQAETVPKIDMLGIPFHYNLWRPPPALNFITQDKTMPDKIQLKMPDKIQFWYSLCAPEQTKKHTATVDFFTQNTRFF